MRSVLCGLFLSVALAPILAHAQEEQRAACTGTAPLPAAYAPWASQADLVSAAAVVDLPKAELTPGHAVKTLLHPTRQVAYVTQPEKPGGSVAKGGMLALKIEQAGLYRVALSAGPWIDVLKDGKVLVSTAHSQGPACTGIRKMVDFALQPGGYVLQISANPDEQLTVMLLRQP